MASRQEPPPPLPASQPCPAPSIPPAARARAAAVPLVGCGRTPGSAGVCGEGRAWGWVVPPCFAGGKSRSCEGREWRRDNRLLCSYLRRPGVGWGFGLQISNQCSLFLPVDGQPRTGSPAGTRGQQAGLEVSARSYPWGVRSCPGGGEHRAGPPPQTGTMLLRLAAPAAGFVPAACALPGSRQCLPSIFRFLER